MKGVRSGRPSTLRASLATAGERLSIDCEPAWVAELIREGAGGPLGPVASEATIDVRVEDRRDPFDVRGWEPIARGAWSRGGSVVIADACTSGFDLLAEPSGERPIFTFRWRPPPRDRVAALALRSRFHLLVRSILLQYPAMWWAGTRGRVPLHASAYSVAGRAPLVAGPSGVGKSTLLARELEGGARATSDNLCVGDGTTMWGVAEPLRREGGSGRRMPHGRREEPFVGRVPSITVDRLVLLRRGTADRAVIRSCEPRSAARGLESGTYMAGELRRYWPLAAALAQGSGIGPAHPPINAVAADLAGLVPCLSLEIPAMSPARRDALSMAPIWEEASSWT